MLFSGHIRNLGGISNSNLYTKTYTGTKKLIEDYLDAVCESFKFIHQSQSGMQLDRPGAIDDGHAESLEDFDSKQPPMGTNYIYRYFCESLQSLGRSALLLTGGFSLGMYHLGVVKALYLQNFLPDIICGIDIGSFVAALICCVPPERLGKLLLDPIEMINFDVFKGISNDGSMNRKIARYLRYGHFLNIKTLESLARSNIGDITFFESFLISKKILNITVSLGVNKDINYVLNYLTAPDIVLILIDFLTYRLSGVLPVLPLLIAAYLVAFKYCERLLMALLFPGVHQVWIYGSNAEHLFRNSKG